MERVNASSHKIDCFTGLGHSKSQRIGRIRLYNCKGKKSILYFSEEQNPNFTEDRLGGDERSAATHVSSQTVQGKIWIWLPVKYNLKRSRP